MLAFTSLGCAEANVARVDEHPVPLTFVAGQSRFVAGGPITIDSATIVDGAAKVFFYLRPGAARDEDCTGLSDATAVVELKDNDMNFEVPWGQGVCVTSTRNAPTDDTPVAISWHVPQTR